MSDPSALIPVNLVDAAGDLVIIEEGLRRGWFHRAWHFILKAGRWVANAFCTAGRWVANVVCTVVTHPAFPYAVIVILAAGVVYLLYKNHTLSKQLE